MDDDLARRIMAHAFNDEMEKIAALVSYEQRTPRWTTRVSNLEDRLGFYLSDKEEAKARKLLHSKAGRSFVLRHPWLTGLPTLGIAPAVASERVYSDVMRKLLRQDPSLRERHSASRQAKRRRRHEDYDAETKRLKATESSRSARTLALTALVAQKAHYDKDK